MTEPQVVSEATALTYAQIRRQARALAEHLKEAGLQTGDRIVFLLKNDVHYFVARLAVEAIGAREVPISSRAAPDEVLHILQDCGARCIVVHTAMLERVAQLLPRTVVFAVSVGPVLSSACPCPCLPLETLNPSDCDISETVMTRPILYTSGTTGKQKGVVRQSTMSPKERIDWIMDRYAFEAGGVALITGPMHVSAMQFFSRMAFRAGMKIVLLEKFEPEEFLRAVERHQVTTTHLVPTMMVRLARTLRTGHRWNTNSLKVLVHGGAPCPADVKKALIEHFGPIVSEYYGSTETGGVVSWCSAVDWLEHPQSLGRVVPWMSVRIIGAEGREVASGSVGEIVVKLPPENRFGYTGEATVRTEVQTGDVGWLAEDGRLHLVGRRSDLMIVGGRNVYAAEVEAALLKIEGVVDCIAFPIPDPDQGQRVAAAIVAGREAMELASLIRAELPRFLEPYKRPWRSVFVPSLHREGAGKVPSRVIDDFRKLAQAGSDSVHFFGSSRTSEPTQAD